METQGARPIFISIITLAMLVFLSILLPDHVIRLSVEDGIVENLTAALFLLSGLVFLWGAYATRVSRRRHRGSATLFLGAWGILLILFAGEEISWGQRIFDFSTPENLVEINRQQEFNVHNLEVVHNTFGGTHRFLSIMMIGMGVLLPLAYRLASIRKTIDKFGIPVPSPACAVLFIGAYAYGIFYTIFNPFAEVGLRADFLYSAIEVRELILALATTCFAFDTLRRTLRSTAGVDRFEAG
jgi:hypothetical protein